MLYALSRDTVWIASQCLNGFNIKSQLYGQASAKSPPRSSSAGLVLGKR